MKALYSRWPQMKALYSRGPQMKALYRRGIHSLQNELYGFDRLTLHIM